jgi:hypothetical protein
VSESPSDYELGVTAGNVAAQLEDHAQHFKVINGSIVDGKEATLSLEREVHALRLVIQRMADQTDADAQTRVKLAETLKAAADARWGPWQKIFTVIGATGVLVGEYFALRGF